MYSIFLCSLTFSCSSSFIFSLSRSTTSSSSILPSFLPPFFHSSFPASHPFLPQSSFITPSCFLPSPLVFIVPLPSSNPSFLSSAVSYKPAFLPLLSPLPPPSSPLPLSCFLTFCPPPLPFLCPFPAPLLLFSFCPSFHLPLPFLSISILTHKINIPVCT